VFKVTPNGINRIDIAISGKLNLDDMKIALDELVSKSQKINNGQVLYKISDYYPPPLGAIQFELSRILSRIRN
jgi:hypothetical protein